jgi:Tol biopolymer transport system component
MNADGSGQTQRTGTEGSGEQSPAWSPDGTRIVFVSNRAAPRGGTTGPELWVMDADGSDVRRLSDTTEAASLAPAWSPDGTRIAYALLCFASDRKGGPPHVVKGMLGETRVR